MRYRRSLAVISVPGVKVRTAGGEVGSVPPEGSFAAAGMLEHLLSLGGGASE